MKKRQLTDLFGSEKSEIVIYLFDKNKKEGKIQSDMAEKDYFVFFIDELFGRSENYLPTLQKLQDNRCILVITIEEASKIQSLFTLKTGTERERILKIYADKEPKKRVIVDLSKLTTKTHAGLRNNFYDVDRFFEEHLKNKIIKY